MHATEGRLQSQIWLLKSCRGGSKGEVVSPELSCAVTPSQQDLPLLQPLRAQGEGVEFLPAESWGEARPPPTSTIPWFITAQFKRQAG